MGRRRETFDRIDRVGGKLVYRAIGVIVTGMTAAAGFASWRLLVSADGTGGDRIAGAVFGVCAVLLGWLAVWCFSPKRRLSDLE